MPTPDDEEQGASGERATTSESEEEAPPSSLVPCALVSVSETAISRVRSVRRRTFDAATALSNHRRLGVTPRPPRRWECDTTAACACGSLKKKRKKKLGARNLSAWNARDVGLQLYHRVGDERDARRETPPASPHRQRTIPHERRAHWPPRHVSTRERHLGLMSVGAC
eukprot:172567-Prymnesium_polylepis.1